MSVRLVRAFVVAGAALGVSSCMSFVIEGAGDRDKTTAAQKVEETIHGSFWGFLWVKPVVAKCEKNHELYRIKYHQNALYVLASAATLGAYVPQAIEWWCVPREDAKADEGRSLKPRPR
ncbi:MAG: Bor family protein [Betaproteobacteria bacterium]|nr:Bor family protein [Betaproteobacteria bacterium]